MKLLWTTRKDNILTGSVIITVENSFTKEKLSVSISPTTYRNMNGREFKRIISRLTEAMEVL